MTQSAQHEAGSKPTIKIGDDGFGATPSQKSGGGRQAFLGKFGTRSVAFIDQNRRALRGNARLPAVIFAV